jgi:hypothetical protein
MELEDGCLYTPEQVCENGWLGWDTTPGAIRKAASRGQIEFTRYPPTPHGRIYLTAANIRTNHAAGLCLAKPANDAASRQTSQRPLRTITPAEPRQGVPVFESRPDRRRRKAS